MSKKSTGTKKEAAVSGQEWDGDFQGQGRKNEIPHTQSPPVETNKMSLISSRTTGPGLQQNNSLYN